MKLTSAFLETQLRSYRRANRIIIGYSGGVDSHVLLHLLAHLPDFVGRVTAIYIDHGLQDHSEEWGKHCREIAQELKVDCKVLGVDARAMSGQSPEEAARDARYQAFSNFLGEEDVLLFAQHQDDQLETVFLQLFRGAGLKGLSGMPVEIPFAQGTLCRPLLNICQRDIDQYAEKHQLQWIEDPSNHNVKFDRNYLRQTIIPLLKQRWPSLSTTVARVANHCSDAQLVLSESAQLIMRQLYHSQTQSLSILGLLEEEVLMQQWIIRAWLESLERRMPTQKVMNAILSNVLLAGQSSNPIVRHDEGQIRRYKKHLYFVLDKALFDLKQVITWGKDEKILDLPNNGKLVLSLSEVGISERMWRQGNVQVRYRQGGEKIALVNRTGRHWLKKLYQEASVVPWLRDEIPLVYINGELASIGGHWVNADMYCENQVCVELGWTLMDKVCKVI